MALLTWRTWVWASSRRWWWTGKPGVLQSMGSQRVGHDWVTELNWRRSIRQHTLRQGKCPIVSSGKSWSTACPRLFPILNSPTQMEEVEHCRPGFWADSTTHLLCDPDTSLSFLNLTFSTYTRGKLALSYLPHRPAVRLWILTSCDFSKPLSMLTHPKDQRPQCACVRACSVTHLCLTLCHPVNYSLQGFSVHGFSRQESWSGLPYPPPGDLPDPGIEPKSPASSALQQILYCWATREA